MSNSRFDEIQRRGGKRKFTIFATAKKLDSQNRVITTYTVAVKVWAQNFDKARSIVKKLIEHDRKDISEISRKNGWVGHQTS